MTTSADDSISTASTALEDAANTAATPVDEAEAEIASPLGLTASDQRFLWGAGMLIVVLCGVHWGLLSGWGRREVEITRLPERRLDFRVDINHATWVEWMQLENIGELTARKIVEDRETRGPFGSVDDVDRVPGIGPKTLAAIRPWLICGDCPPVSGTKTE